MRHLRSILFWLALLAPGAAFPATAAAAHTPMRDIRILASFYPVYIATLNVAQGMPGVRVDCMAPQTAGCPHGYHLRPADMVALSTASVLVINGLGMETFLAGATNRTPPLPVINASADIVPMSDADGEPNPHVWLSVSNAIRQVHAIAEGLARIDPARAPMYVTNCARYVASLELLRKRHEARVKSLPHRTMVTQHAAFPYLARDLGLTVVAVIQQDHGESLSASRLRAIAGAMRTAHTTTIFTEPGVNDRAASTLARETGANVYLLNPIVSGPSDTNAYITAMDANLRTLEEALK